MRLDGAVDKCAITSACELRVRLLFYPHVRTAGPTSAFMWIPWIDRKVSLRAKPCNEAVHNCHWSLVRLQFVSTPY